MTTAIVSIGSAGSITESTPEQDRITLQNYYKQRLPGIHLSEYPNGVYAIDMASRKNWEAIEDFPPYGPYIADGEDMWDTQFTNGKGYKDCFPEPAIAHLYPKWDEKQGKVITLPLAVNQCRKVNGEKPFKYYKGDITLILSYIAFKSRGKITNVTIPKDDPRALEAYNQGKKFYYTRRGQLNYACATCHMQNVGKYLRSEILSPAMGHTTGWPVYRSDWTDVGTLHRRIRGCMSQIRAKPFKAQSKQYRNLEYFLTYMSNGLPLNGPSSRK
ncbi:MAG: sulfur oxidation c-type cytochrome SoxA [Gammaproteobacteria bacterium]|nr:sulfur oxidation c-type cytochrome SoxA [Gammaproteobacteria bacterium]